MEAWAVLTFISHGFAITIQLLTFIALWFQQNKIKLLLNKVWIGIQPRNPTSLILSNPNFFIYFAYIANIISGIYSSFRREVIWAAASSFVDQFLSIENPSGKKYIVHILYVFFFFLQRMNSVYDLLVISAVLSIREVSREFQLRILRVTNPHQLMVMHNELKEVFNIFNGVFSYIFLNHTIATFLYYLATPVVLSKMEFSLDKLYKVVYLSMHCVTYITACGIYSMVFKKS
ncbi:unnamed protein product [Orchesella dallaii]|uniref:Uncharacterized protein n=1 Tax=Orchesella dallaii TaxID=48710 RepID=A0ABP1QWI7_9HEXA